MSAYDTPCIEPDVSIVIPTRDRSDLLRDAIASALGQKGVTVEVIVVNDGSSEDLSWVKEYSDFAPVRYLRTRPVGVARARNLGAAEARGRYLAFLDSDDILLPRKSIRQVRSLENCGGAWSCTGFYRFDVTTGRRDTNCIPQYTADVWRLGCPLGASSILIQRQEFERIGGFDSRLPLSEDWDLFIRLAERSAPVLCPETLYIYRRGCGNISDLPDAQWIRSWHMISEKHDLNFRGRSLLRDLRATCRFGGLPVDAQSAARC